MQKFRSVFGEIRFPSRSVKEELAKEFGISFKQVINGLLVLNQTWLL